MKRLFFITALITATFISAMAARPTKAENDAAMQVGRKALASKIIELENSVKSHNSANLNTVSSQVLDLMRRGMSQTSVEINFESGEQQKASFKHYNEIEKTLHEYTLLMKEPSANGQQLINHAQAFLKAY